MDLPHPESSFPEWLLEHGRVYPYIINAYVWMTMIGDLITTQNKYSCLNLIFSTCLWKTSFNSCDWHSAVFIFLHGDVFNLYMYIVFSLFVGNCDDFLHGYCVYHFLKLNYVKSYKEIVFSFITRQFSFHFSSPAYKLSVHPFVLPSDRPFVWLHPRVNLQIHIKNGKCW